MDTKALAHILTHDSVYQKPYKVRTFIAEMLGTGTLLSEGEQHRRQVSSILSLPDLRPDHR
ncbi:hypothetical protein BD413DRAFT_583283 [Trametes elegans]|nr:hypothetical protein BD413DRAFT_583283 [Trametes elegans]